MPGFMRATLCTYPVRWLLVGTLWVISLIVGLSLLMNHDFAKGAAGHSPINWPTESQIPRSDHDFTLVMFAHPRCPCTRASLEELTKLLAANKQSVKTNVVFYKPSGADDSWDHTDQSHTAAKIPNVSIVSDVNGIEARLFDAQTSGQTLLFGPTGELLFSGGITMARGHVGDNVGRDAIEAILSKSPPGTRTTPVYGCPIILPTTGK